MQDSTMPQFGISSSTSSSNGSSGIKKEQILPALVAIFGFLALVFMVSTIALAVNGNSAKTEKDETVTVISVDDLSDGALGFYPKKVENPTTDATYRLSQTIKNADGHTALSATIIQSNNGVDIVVNWEFVKAYYNMDILRNDREVFSIETTQPVADIMIGRASNYVQDDVLLILFADGTIDYVPIVQALEKRDFNSRGQLGSVTNVVKFYKVAETLPSSIANAEKSEDTASSNDDTDKMETIETVVAQKADGSLVDLRELLLTAVGKDLR